MKPSRPGRSCEKNSVRRYSTCAMMISSNSLVYKGIERAGSSPLLDGTKVDMHRHRRERKALYESRAEKFWSWVKMMNANCT